MGEIDIDLIRLNNALSQEYLGVAQSAVLVATDELLQARVANCPWLHPNTARVLAIAGQRLLAQVIDDAEDI